jgi:hypothetical protein
MHGREDEAPQVSIEWRQEPTPYVYWYGTTPTRFSFQIGESTNRGRFMALVFHDDFRFCVRGEETDSVQEAKDFCARWIAENAKT